MFSNIFPEVVLLTR